MHAFTYIKSEPTLWTVGFHKPNGEWEPESDHGTSSEAFSRANWLNGDGDVWVYLKSEPSLWTVGHYDGTGQWQPVSDHGSQEDAARETARLNRSL
jgi:hypothetical protein